ncbi:MAG: GntR family transcriptional regulator [Planctomycetota bacterium]|nr:GntR family transcriptional regulator [Planctomycetota bacterium]
MDKVAEAVRAMVLSGGIPTGSYLPAEREMVARYGVSRMTVRRALRYLAKEGLIEVVPHRGYRLLPPKAVSSATAGMVAYILAQAGPSERWDRTHEQILAAFNRELLPRGRRVLAVGAKGAAPSRVMEEAKASGAEGVALDTSRIEFVEAAVAARLPCVVVDASVEAPGTDVVIQDNFNGARKAAEFLLLRGCRRIGWVGPMRGNAHARERFAGARSALAEAGMDFAPGLMAEVPHGDIGKAAGAVSAMLSAAGRPDGLVCMWLESALGAARALRAAGMEPGREVEIVAWATEREYRELLAPEFIGGSVPATAVWRPEEMAALALERLDARAKNPFGPPVRLDVRMRLLEPAAAEAVLRGGSASAAEAALREKTAPAADA